MGLVQNQLAVPGKATITNMGAELGATCSIFEYDERMELYLRATGRHGIADLANLYKDQLTGDYEIEKEIENEEFNSSKYFDQIIRIDLSKLEPYIAGPHTPDLARPISKMAEDVKKNDYLDVISVALMGSYKFFLRRHVTRR